jgi:hypothetical protein
MSYENFRPLFSEAGETLTKRQTGVEVTRHLRYHAYKESVMIELTEQQRHELSAPEPVAIDPETQETYVLVRREVYDHLKTLLALDDYDPDEGAGVINEVMALDDAKDPYLESYQHYGKKA